MAYNYQSDTTQFLNELLEKRPELAQEQLTNRHILWDVTLDADEQKAFKEASIPKKPYAYQTN